MFGASPLRQAAAQGDQVLGDPLLLRLIGADPWSLDDGGRTPPQLATRSGDAAFAKLLSFYAASPRTAHARGPSLDDQTRAPEPTGILRVSTDAGHASPEMPLTRTDAAAQPTGQ